MNKIYGFKYGIIQGWPGTYWLQLIGKKHTMNTDQLIKQSNEWLQDMKKIQPNIRTDRVEKARWVELERLIAMNRARIWLS